MTHAQTQLRSRDVILREEDFAALLEVESRELARLTMGALGQRRLLANGNFVHQLAETAHALETILDDHGARQNRRFVTFGETVASIRGLAMVKVTGLHLESRLDRYVATVAPDLLRRDLDRGFELLDAAAIELLRELSAEAGRLGFTWNQATVSVTENSPQRRLLPRNLDADASVDERQHLASLGGRFLSVLEASRALDLGFEREPGDLADFVVQHATEERCRWYESAVHNIQSMYDTYVLGTALEREYDWLPRVRGHASVAFHLLEMATGLVHFYERHENDIRHEPAREIISTLVSKAHVLDVAVNVCLRQAYLYVEAAAPLAQQILDTFVSSTTVSMRMPEGLILHARPLALIVQVARHYGTPIELTIDGETCSANSLMGLILVGGRHPTPKTIEARGDASALRDLTLLFEAGLGERGDEFPPELGYLKAGDGAR